jgi:chromosome segregation ATPase
MAIYYGIPAVYRDFIEPTQLNAERIETLERELAQVQEAAQRQEEQNTQRIADLEGQLAEHNETISELQVAQERFESDIEGARMELDDLAQVIVEVDRVEAMLLQVSEDLGDLQFELEAIGDPAADLEFQLRVAQAMTLLTKAQVGLAQDNLGSASDDVRAAREILAAVPSGNDDQELSQAIRRLDMALEEIRTNPELAAAELDVAWTLLISLTGQATKHVEPVVPLPTPEEDSDGSQ